MEKKRKLENNDSNLLTSTPPKKQKKIQPDWLIQKIEENKDFIFKPNYENDPLLHEEDPNEKFVPLVVKYPKILKFYTEKMLPIDWKPSDISTSVDITDYRFNLNQDQKNLIIKVLAFFLVSDSVVAENIMKNFYTQIKSWEIRGAYSFQMNIEFVHIQTYRNLYVAFTDKLPDTDMVQFFKNPIGKKIEFARNWMDNENLSLHEKLVGFAAVEAIGFSSSFAFIGYFKSVLKKLPGVCLANDKISADEATHWQLTDLVLDLLKDKLPEWRIQMIFSLVVDLEIEYVKTILEKDLPGMTQELMIQYVLFVCDQTLKFFGCKPLYEVTNPFKFMETFALDGISSFFERRPSEYQTSQKLEKKLVFDKNQTIDF